MPKFIYSVAGLSILLIGCASTPEVPEARIIIPPQIVETCTPISALEQVVVPAEVQTYYATTEIENPPYEPITRTEKMTREITPRRVYYVDSMGKEVTDLCDKEPLTN